MASRVALPLALLMESYIFDDIFNYDKDRDDVLFFGISSLNNKHYRRRSQPKVSDFVEVTLQQYNSEDFRRDFRLNRSTFSKLLNLLSPKIAYEERAIGRPPLSAEKQLLLYIWYMSNQDSMREISRLFGVSTSTCHKVCIKYIQIMNIIINSNIEQDYKMESKNVNAYQISFSDFILRLLEECQKHCVMNSLCYECVGFIDGTHVRLVSAPAIITGKGSHHVSCSLLLTAIC